MDSSAAIWKSHRVLLADKEISLGATKEVTVDPDLIEEKNDVLAREFSDLEIESIGREDLHR
jgi:hypothetical protein